MRKVLVVVTCIVAILCISILPVNNDVDNPTVNRFVEQTPAQLLSGQVVITSNSAMLSAGFDGAGTIEDPFRIYSLYIPVDGTYGIWISNVDYYFDIWDCLLTGSTLKGIGIRNCNNANITDTTIQGSEVAIAIEDTPFVFIENCQLTPDSAGIGLTLSDVTFASIADCTFIGGSAGSSLASTIAYYDDNTFVDCVNGILGEPASNCVIANNRFENCSSYGIRLEDNSHGMTILGNTFTGFYTGGVLLRYTQSMSIMSNNFTHCGLTVIGSSSYHYNHIVEGNRVNSKPLLYLYEHDSVFYSGDDYGQIYLISCDDVALQGGLITSTQRGVFIAYSTNCIVQDMMITACQAGVTIDDSEYITVKNCTIRSCSTGLILFSGANHNSFLSNQISYSWNEGVLFNPSTTSNLLVNNSFHHNDDGLLDQGSENSWDDGEAYGNFYDNYNGTGVYNIPGTANSVDHYPRRYIASSTGGGLQAPVSVVVVVGLGISLTGVIIVLLFLKRIWSKEGF